MCGKTHCCLLRARRLSYAYCRPSAQLVKKFSAVAWVLYHFEHFEKFLWSNTAESYISSINKIVSNHGKRPSLKESLLDFGEEIETYLRNDFE